MQQFITPDPGIPCQPGWCLQYVRQAFDLPARYSTATEAWDNSSSQHPDRDYPQGVWHPVWYGLDSEPAGHVVLRAPDGSVYSTSDLTNTPHHHPDLDDLENYYARYGMNLTYRGWTEDVAGYPVIGEDMTPEERKTLFEVLDRTGNQLQAVASTLDELKALIPSKQYQDDNINAVARIDAVNARLDAVLTALENAK